MFFVTKSEERSVSSYPEAFVISFTKMILQSKLQLI